MSSAFSFSCRATSCPPESGNDEKRGDIEAVTWHMATAANRQQPQLLKSRNSRIFAIFSSHQETRACGDVGRRDVGAGVLSHSVLRCPRCYTRDAISCLLASCFLSNLASQYSHHLPFEKCKVFLCRSEWASSVLRPQVCPRAPGTQEAFQKKGVIFSYMFS